MKYLTLILSVLALSSCISVDGSSDIDIAKPKEISYDDNEQNAGIICQVDSGGFIITENALDRYNALISKHKKNVNPNLKKNFGITTVYLITDEGMENFAILNIYDKNQSILK